MNRPTLEVANIFRAKGDSFIERNQNRISYQQLKVMRAITSCRTAALGGHLDACLAAATRPSRLTPAATGTAPSVRPRARTLASTA